MYKWRSSIRAKFDKALSNHYNLPQVVVAQVLDNEKLLHPQLLDSLTKVSSLHQEEMGKLLVAHCEAPSTQLTIPEQLGKVPSDPRSSLPHAMSHLLASTTKANDTRRLTADKLLELVSFLYQQSSLAELERILENGIIKAHGSIEKMKFGRVAGGIDLAATPQIVTDTI